MRYPISLRRYGRINNDSLSFCCVFLRCELGVFTGWCETLSLFELGMGSPPCQQIYVMVLRVYVLYKYVYTIVTYLLRLTCIC